MKTIRLLFTGAGRRIELVQAFKQAALVADINLKIYGVDMTNSAPALAFCDFTRLVCGMRESGYIDELLKICVDDKIDMLIPTIDTDLLVLAQNKHRFESIGTKVLVSAEDKIAICRDKNLTADFFVDCGLKAPITVADYNNYECTFPCFIKPKDGSSSINAFKVNNQEELLVYSHLVKDYIIQPFIDGTEYTVDVFCDYDGNPVTIIPRIRLAVRAGEVLKTQIVLDEKIIKETRHIIKKFKPCGPMTVQLIREKKSGDDYYIEINPRFGGGSTLSMKAGSQSAAVVLGMIEGKKYPFSNASVLDNAIYSRFDQSVCVSNTFNAERVRGVIFDLDDTLYSEKMYVRSGYKAVAKYLGRPDAEARLWELFQDGKPAIDCYLAEHGLLDEKAACITSYRNHIPEIELYPEVKELLQHLKQRNIKVGIITDGRIESQNNKIDALGLRELVDDIIITDEFGGEQFRKPCDIAYRIIQRRWKLSFEELVYVGDNAGKDFVAPRGLGMYSVWFDNADGLYRYECNNESYVKIISLRELWDMFVNAP